MLFGCNVATNSFSWLAATHRPTLPNPTDFSPQATSKLNELMARWLFERSRHILEHPQEFTEQELEAQGWRPSLEMPSLPQLTLAYPQEMEEILHIFDEEARKVNPAMVARNKAAVEWLMGQGEDIQGRQLTETELFQLHKSVGWAPGDLTSAVMLLLLLMMVVLFCFLFLVFFLLHPL